MKTMTKIWQLLLPLVLLALVPVGFAGSTRPTKTNPVHAAQHASPGDFWDNVRLKPVKVTEIQRSTVYWTFEDKGRIELGSFQTEERTVYPKDFQAGKTYLAVWCATHNTVYEFQDWR